MRFYSSTELMFSHLSKQNPATGKPCEHIPTADTLFLRHRVPSSYFRYREPFLVRLHKDKVSLEAFVEEAALAPGDICAVAVTALQPGRDSSKGFQRQVDLIQNLRFCYFSKQKLRVFAANLPPNSQLILQKFLVPDEGRNSIYVAEWSQCLISVSKKVNKFKLGERRLLLQERLDLTTNESKHCRDEVLVPNVLKREISGICGAIRKHLWQLSCETFQLRRMKLWFVRSGGKFCLRGFSELQFSRLQRLSVSSFRVIDTRIAECQVQGSPSGKGSLEQECLNCCKMSIDFCSLQHRHIVKTFEAAPESCFIFRQQELEDFRAMYEKVLLQQNEGLEGSQKQAKVNEALRSVPQLLVKTSQGYILKEKYDKLVANHSWLESTVPVCRACYLKYTQYTIHRPLRPRKRPSQFRHSLLRSFSRPLEL